ncbi:MAG: LysR substrate-binding domain-containing protein [Pikeienuella sp.]
MTIRLLKTLVAVADSRTFSAAANVVHVTHAAVSQQMQTLEADLGVSLFDRTSRTPELTPFAVQLVARARELIAEYDNLVPSILEDGGLTGIVRLGALRTTLTGLAPQALAQLKLKYPKIWPHIIPGMTDMLLTEIERGNIDAAIVAKPHVIPIGVILREIAVEKMHLIVSLDEHEDDPEVLLANRPFIRFNRNAVVGSLIENWLQSKRIRVSETMELDSPEAIASMVQAKLGVSIVPDLVVKSSESARVKQIDLGHDAPDRTLVLAYKEKTIKQAAIDELYNALMIAIGKPEHVS